MTGRREPAEPEETLFWKGRDMQFMKRAAKKRGKRFSITPYIMIFPAYSVYLVFVLVPVIAGFWFSFTNYDFYKKMDFVGLQNYINLFHDEDFLHSIANTLEYAFFTIVPTLALGIVLAVLVNKGVHGTNFFRACMYIPNVGSMVALSMVWLWIFDPTVGFLNQLVTALGLPAQQWLFNEKTAMPCLIIMGIWRSVGYNMVIALSGLQGIPADLYEAARIDGASEVKQFFSITLPMLRPTTFFLLVTGCINSFMVFEQVNIMTGGGPLSSTTTIVHQIYKSAFLNFRGGYGSAMAMVLLAMTILFTLLNFRFGNQGSDAELG